MKTSVFLLPACLMLSLAPLVMEAFAGDPESPVSATSVSVPLICPSAIKTRNVESVGTSTESLADAVIRINERLDTEYGPFAPKMLTETTFRNALEFSANEIAGSSKPNRRLLVAVLTTILRDNSIPADVRFALTTITGHDKNLESEFAPRKYVNTVSLNYTLIVPVGPHAKEMIGLSSIIEGFHIVR